MDVHLGEETAITKSISDEEAPTLNAAESAPVLSESHVHSAPTTQADPNETPTYTDDDESDDGAPGTSDPTENEPLPPRSASFPYTPMVFGGKVGIMFAHNVTCG